MLKDHIKEIREGIKAGLFTNEASVSQGIVLRLLHALSWPRYNPQIVFPEYPLTGRRVDFALCHPPGNPLVFIEVKPLGQSDTGERQLFEYAFHIGVQMAILTDGHEWHFFLPAEQGDYGERRVYKLDIVERDIDEIARRLERYLKYEAVCSGAAIESARADYKDVARDRLIKTKLPEAWSKLIQDEDELLLELVAERVESLCGYKPDPDIVASFLRTNVILRSSPIKVPLSKPEPTPIQKSEPHLPPVTPSQNIGFSIDGKWHPARNAKDVLVNVFLSLDKRDPNFLERFAALPRHGSRRRYLSRTTEELYPGRLDLVRSHSFELKPGWWLGINISKKQVDKIIDMACGVAGIKYGTELRVNLGL
jgi:hypothetical protein